MKLFYGALESEWESLCNEAENLLYDFNLGQHILGIYTAGNRLYGLEEFPPGAMCIYMDSTRTLLDPFSVNNTGFNIYHVGNHMYPIIMVDLFKWLSWINNPPIDYRSGAWFHVIPYSTHILYEDEIMSYIAQKVKILNKYTKHNYNIKKMSTGCFKEFLDIIPNNNLKVYYRAVDIYKKYNIFSPNINKNWDNIFDEFDKNKHIKKETSQKEYQNIKKELQKYIIELYEKMI